MCLSGVGFFFFFFKILFIYERESVCIVEEGAEGEGQAESLLSTEPTMGSMI